MCFGSFVGTPAVNSVSDCFDRGMIPHSTSLHRKQSNGITSHMITLTCRTHQTGTRKEKRYRLEHGWRVEESGTVLVRTFLSGAECQRGAERDTGQSRLDPNQSGSLTQPSEDATRLTQSRMHRHTHADNNSTPFSSFAWYG